jgi:hypothetical protein
VRDTEDAIEIDNSAIVERVRKQGYVSGIEAWCHQRGYVCFIQELWGRDVAPGGRISAAYVVGFFDTKEAMEVVHDTYRGKIKIVVSEAGYTLR